MTVKLLLQNGELDQGEVHSDQLPLTFGRSRQADVWLDDRWASRLHCELHLEQGQLTVRDLNSTFGTLVNGEHVQKAPLCDGDRLSIGLSTFVVSYEADPQGELDKVLVAPMGAAIPTRDAVLNLST